MSDVDVYCLDTVVCDIARFLDRFGFVCTKDVENNESPYPNSFTVYDFYNGNVKFQIISHSPATPKTHAEFANYIMKAMDMDICKNYYDGHNLVLSNEFVERSQVIENLNLHVFRKRVLKYLDRGYIFTTTMPELNYDVVEHILLAAASEPELTQDDAKSIFLTAVHYNMARAKNKYHSTNAAAQHGHIDVLEWHVTNGFNAYLDNAFACAAGHEQLDVLDWFMSVKGVKLNWDDTIDHAAISNATLSLEWFADIKDFDWPRVVGMSFYAHADKSLAWFEETLHIRVTWDEILDALFVTPMELLLGWLETGRKCVDATNIAVTSARNDDADVIRELMEYNIDIDWAHVCNAAVAEEAIDVLDILFDYDKELAQSAAMYAALDNQINILDFIRVNVGTINWGSVADVATMFGCVEVLAYIKYWRLA
ncbi:hypothetical protein GGF31_003421 [Allomyces arbusculus]|nr:hypothetical protein GGF31_003421 [Allomyces arbusculus]